MLSVFFAVLLLPSIFDVVLSSNFSFRIESCNATEVPQSQVVGDYSYGGTPSVPLCPLSSSSSDISIRWIYDLNGNASVFSNQSFSPDQICVGTEVGTDQTKLFFLNSFVSNRGNSVGSLSLLVNGTYTLNVQDAPKGIFLIEPSNNSVSLDEGQSYSADFIFLTYFGLSKAGQLEEVMEPNLYKVSASGDFRLVPSSNIGVSINRFIDINSYCAPSMMSTPVPKPVRVLIRNPGVSDSGTYAMIVNISGVNYTTNFTINVSPLTTTISPSPTTTDSTITPSSAVSTSDSSLTISTTGSSVSPSVDTTITLSPVPTDDTSGISLVVYVFCAVLGLLGVAVLIIFVIVVAFCYRKLKNGRVSETLPSNVQLLGDDEVKIGGIPLIAESGRTDSNSSTKPLVVTSQPHGSRPSSTSSTPSTTKQEDYTAVYCGERHTHIGSTWKEKYGNKCVLLHSDDEILESLENPSCHEIFVHADPQDPVAKAIMSRGSPKGREKLKWWHIVEHDKTPDHLIEAEGFKIVQVEGDPNDISTLQRGMLKTDNPTLNHTNGALYENHTPNGHTISNPSASYLEDTDSEKKKPKEEIDGATLKELLKETKKTNQILDVISKNTGKTAENTNQIAATESAQLDLQQMAQVVDEAQVGINEASV
ncbi:PREDICTED: uncharacterized protein LOC100640835 [Amphimedon queenslandica]|uniref:Ig-like domain-containing protein n=1 Tax=Amphimedon queenslandica TaxID=400682 RepID=A0A1X7UZ25_AMPQE|nr:PREDICTED: uncharacterized protein LOC100640835 [Amphimedon queenslandica]|eukprot:XP_019851426.1 PREDICTED: uncharacterized protein LOC100640835 [Amphimedon queenslandica]